MREYKFKCFKACVGERLHNDIRIKLIYGIVGYHSHPFGGSDLFYHIAAFRQNALVNYNIITHGSVYFNCFHNASESTILVFIHTVYLFFALATLLEKCLQRDCVVLLESL